MRNLFCYIALLFIASSCSVDELPGCDGNGLAGEICKEYQYVYGEYNGLNSYMYNEAGDRLLIKVTQSKTGSEEGSTYYSYDDQGRRVGVELRGAGGNVIQTQSFFYNSNNELFKEETVGDETNAIVYSYSNGILIAKTYATDGAVYQVDSMEYYAGTSTLYRTLKYAQGSVFEIEYVEWFGEGIKRESRYDNFGVKLGSSVERFNGSAELIEKIEYTENDNVKTTSNYDYINGVLNEIIKTDLDSEVFEKLVYQRY